MFEVYEEDTKGEQCNMMGTIPKLYMWCALVLVVSSFLSLQFLDMASTFGNLFFIINITVTMTILLFLTSKMEEIEAEEKKRK